MLDHVFHTNIIAYRQQNWYVRLAIYTDSFTLKCFFTTYYHTKIKGIKELQHSHVNMVTVIELQNKNEENVISYYSQIKKIENISCEEISTNCNLLIAQIILNNRLE